MVVIVLPEWYGRAREELDRAIIDIALKNNIEFHFVKDSKTIHDSVDAIMDVFLRISSDVKCDYKYIDDNSRKTKTKSKTGGKKNG